MSSADTEVFTVYQLATPQGFSSSKVGSWDGLWPVDPAPSRLLYPQAWREPLRPPPPRGPTCAPAPFTPGECEGNRAPESASPPARQRTGHRRPTRKWLPRSGLAFPGVFGLPLRQPTTDAQRAAAPRVLSAEEEPRAAAAGESPCTWSLLSVPHEPASRKARPARASERCVSWETEVVTRTRESRTKSAADGSVPQKVKCL